MVVFSLGRKKKPGCKHKLYFLEKECAFPTCLFIYKPWERWVPWPRGTRAPSGPVVLCMCASPALGRLWPTVVSCLGTKCRPLLQMALAARGWAPVLLSLTLPARNPSHPIFCPFQLAL